MTTRSRLVLTLALITACGGDDGIRHLPDAPWLDGAMIDSQLDAGVDDIELGITLAGTGGGTISSSPAGIACGATCTSAFPRDTIVTLTAVPDTGSVFGGWSGACTGTVPTCEITLADVANATATFTLATYTVMVSKSGLGSGTVSGNGINCGATCMITVDHGTAISLSAAPGALSTFAGWGGACSGTSACALTVTGNSTISASFTLDDVTLFVTKGGTGVGTVTTTAAGINCGTDCDETYTAGQTTTLNAVAAIGSTFTGWTGGTCTGTGPCTLTMNAAVTVTASFTLNTYALTVTRTGNGSVTSTPAGIACGSDCSGTYNHGQSVTLMQVASTGSTFAGWGGACSGTGACTVSMTAARTVTATFTLDQHLLTVTRDGTGSGTVSGGAISCGSTCMANLDYGTIVTLIPAPSTGSTFGGWSGACTGTGSCMVTMDMARSVTATFTLNTYVLTVGRDGTGSGSVTGTGISCGTDCVETIGHGQIVTLTAMPGPDSTFTGWSACAGTGTCAVTMDMAKTVTATFTIKSYALTVAKTGPGTVTATGISCGTDCTETFTHGTPVTLTPTTPAGSTFAGWGGSCSGFGSCTLTMNMTHNVTAAWTIDQHTLTVTRTGNGFGTVIGTGISCGTDCAETVNYNTTITLTAMEDTANATRSKFAGWSGACTGLGPCTVTLTAAATVTATFDLAPNLIFASSGVYTGALGGLAGADAKCQAHATAANLPGTYRAYLSSISGNTPINAPTRFGGASNWARVDGVQVMNSITQFTSGLFNPVLLTETGANVAVTQYPYAWTGTSKAGVYNGACSPALAFIPWGGAFGSADVGDITATAATAGSLFAGACGNQYRLYCLGIDRNAQ